MGKMFLRRRERWRFAFVLAQGTSFIFESSNSRVGETREFIASVYPTFDTSKEKVTHFVGRGRLRGRQNVPDPAKLLLSAPTLHSYAQRTSGLAYPADDRDYYLLRYQDIVDTDSIRKALARMTVILKKNGIEVNFEERDFRVKSSLATLEAAHTELRKFVPDKHPDLYIHQRARSWDPALRAIAKLTKECTDRADKARENPQSLLREMQSAPELSTDQSRRSRAPRSTPQAGFNFPERKKFEEWRATMEKASPRWIKKTDSQNKEFIERLAEEKSRPVVEPPKTSRWRFLACLRPKQKERSRFKPVPMKRGKKSASCPSLPTLHE